MSDLKAKMHQNRFRLGFRPKPRWGANTALPRCPPAGFKGLTSKGRGMTFSHRLPSGKFVSSYSM